MSKQQHHPEDRHTFHKGANTDVEGEFVARTPGMYVDGDNQRINVDGGTGASEKIAGETILHPQNALANNAEYVCTGSILVTGKKVEVWCHPLGPGTFPSYFRVDGDVMVISSLLPYTAEYPVQMITMEDCKGGLFMIADDNTIPMVFSLDDIVAAYSGGLATYTSGFNPAAYQINAPAPCHRPRFYGLGDVGEGGGLYPGQYGWAIRYVNVAGDKTNIGVETPLVSVPINLGPYGVGTAWEFIDSGGYPGASLCGALPTAIGDRTRYGAVLRWRIDNRNDYDRIDLIRIEYNKGEGLEAVPVYKVAYQLQLTPGQIGWVEYIDPGNTVEEIPADEAEMQRLFITRAKGIRYVDGRANLGNIGVGARDVNATFTEFSGQRIFPVTKDLGAAGHHDPVQHAYNKGYINGEKYSFGVEYFDGAAGKGFVQPVVDDYQMPNMRDVKAGDSQFYSDNPCFAASVGGIVTPTFEPLNHDVAKQKSDADNFVNICVDASRPNALMNIVPGVTPGPPFQGGVYQSGGVTKTSIPLPLRPTRYDDGDKFGHNYIVNYGVFTQGDDPSTGLDFRPEIFAPKHHALGGYLYGITGIPDGVSGFSVVRKKPAQRVIAQGIAVYCLNAPAGGTTDPATKYTNRVSCWFPDHHMSAIVNEAVKAALIASPGNFRLEVQSARGFTSELYGSANGVGLPGYARGAMCDMMSYARIIHDAGQINPGTGTPLDGGIQPGFPGPIGQNYVGNGRWRNDLPGSSPFIGGNVLFGITQVDEGYEDAAIGFNRFDMLLDAPIYGYGGAPGPTFTSGGTRSFHEPFYIVNLIQEGALTDPVAGYESTGHYQMMRSTIGRYTAAGIGQSFPLIDENAKDCVPKLFDQLRYLWITYPDGIARAWVCITNTSLSSSAILSDIFGLGFWTSPDGTPVYGVYTASTNDHGETVIDFSIIAPVIGSLIEVRYDPTAPCEFYGGDSTISPSIFPRIDRMGKWDTGGTVTPNSTGNMYPTQGCPLPYPAYIYNPRYFVPYEGTLDQPITIPWTMRQWMILFDCQVRAPLHLHNFDKGIQLSFGHIHYVMRPYKYYDANLITDTSTGVGGVFGGYETVYPEENPSSWYMGGIKWRKNLDLDYAASRGIQFFKKSAFYDERLELCNAIAYCEKVNPLDVDSPGYKTWPAENLYFIEANSGEIKRLWSARGGSYGYNLYAICDRGVVLLPISKSVLYSASGEENALSRQDNYLSSEIWLSKVIGMPQEHWRGSAEGAAPVGGDVYEDSLFWPSKVGVYRLTGTTITEIARGKYLKALAPFLGGAGLPPTIMAGNYDRAFNEYWLQIQQTGQSGDTGLFVFCADAEVNNWTGKFDYRFDNYLNTEDGTYGMRDGETFLLNSGPNISGSLVRYRLKIASAPHILERMAWIRMKFGGDTKPTRIEWYDEADQLVAWSDVGTFGPFYLKKEAAWENFVPATNVTVDPAQPQIQGRLKYCVVIHQGDEPFRMPMASFMVKPIK